MCHDRFSLRRRIAAGMSDLEQMVRRQRLLAGFGEFALRSESLDEVLSEACRLVGEALGTQHVRLLEIEGDAQSALLRAAVGWAAEAVGRLRLDLRQGSAGAAWVQPGQPLIFRDIRQETRFEIPAVLKHAGVISMASVPILLPGARLYGLLQVDSDTPRDFSVGQAEFLRAYVTTLGPVIDRLHKTRSLRSAEERYRLIVENARDYAIFVTDTVGNITDWLPGAEAVFGWTAAEAIGQPASLVFTSEDRANKVDLQEIETARAQSFAPDQRWHLRKDGRLVFIDGSVRPLRGEHGEVQGFLKIGQDVTERRRTEEALREREERLRALVNATSNMIYQVSADWSEMRRLEGRGFLSDTTQPRRDWLDKYVPPEDHAMVRAAFEQAIRTRNIYELEHRVLRTDGSVAWTHSRAVPVLDAQGNIREWFGAASDVTARHNAEEALRESEARFRTLFQAMDEGYLLAEVLFDQAGTAVDICFLEANPAAIRMLGTDPRGRRQREIEPGFDQSWYDMWGRVACSGEAERHKRHTSPTGRWYESYLFKPVPEDIESRRVAVIFRDITEQVLAEVELRESEKRFRLMADSAPVLIWMSDMDGQVTFANRYYEHIFGRPASEMLGDGWARILLEEDLEPFLAEMQDAFQAHRPFSIEKRVRDRHGEVRWLRCEGVPRLDEAGRFLGYTGCNVDVTEARLAAEELERRVDARTAELMAAEETLRQAQKMEAVGQLTGGIAHDFNNMLQGVTGGLDMAQRRIAEGRAADALRYLGAAKEAAGRAGALTRRLLAFARRQRLEAKPVDPEALIAGLAELIRRTVGPAITVELRLEEGAGARVFCDATELESTLLNLCINARDAMPEGGRLTIATADLWLSAEDLPEEAKPGRYRVISVTDTGMGMTPEVASRAFEPFFTTKPRGQGTGLGLSQVHGFVQQSGGQVRLESTPGKGTTVCLFLPSREHAEETEPPTAAPPPAQAARAATVLLVDDEEAARQPVADRLRELGHTVLEARDGPEALRFLEAARPDLMVTDVGLPDGMNGRQLAEAARRRWPDLPVMFITGYADTLLPAGFEVIDKPFELDALARQVQALLKQVQARTEGG